MDSGPRVRNSSYSLTPILLKLYRCLDHALRCPYAKINYGYIFRNLNLVVFRTFYNESEWTVGTLCAQLLLQFYSDSFETLHISGSCFEDMHVVWI